MSNARRWLAVSLVGLTCGFPWGACELGEITTTTTTTLDGRDVIVSLVRSAIITPLDAWLTGVVEDFFDQFGDQD
jgi:hypothetical protein